MVFFFFFFSFFSKWVVSCYQVLDNVGGVSD